MLKEAMSQLKTTLILLVLLTLITGLIYPLVFTGLAQFCFPYEAGGSLIFKGNRVIGSRLIGQAFSSAAYFWGRPSATTPYPYNGEASSGSNLGPTNPDFLATVKARISLFKDQQRVPVDLVTASASGLDPEISPYAAYYQVRRVAKARQLPEVLIQQLISEHLKGPTWGFLGEARVNVLELNLALDTLRTQP